MTGLAELLRTRRSGGRITDEAPADAEVAELLSLAMNAPDHGALRPWRMALVRGDARHRLGVALADAQGATGEDRDRRHPLRPAVPPRRLVVPVAHRPAPGRRSRPRRHGTGRPREAPGVALPRPRPRPALPAPRGRRPPPPHHRHAGALPGSSDRLTLDPDLLSLTSHGHFGRRGAFPAGRQALDGGDDRSRPTRVATGAAHSRTSSSPPVPAQDLRCHSDQGPVW
ncbi:MAG: hypothetical protein HOV94_39455 [Saccharothrix sp.]|nr:hypothetical protein [Saccharothrix sp.]